LLIISFEIGLITLYSLNRPQVLIFVGYRKKRPIEVRAHISVYQPYEMNGARDGFTLIYRVIDDPS